MAVWPLRQATLFLGALCAVLTSGCGDKGTSSGATTHPGTTTGAGGDGAAADGSTTTIGSGGGAGSTNPGAVNPEGGPSTGDTTAHTYDADDAHILYSGRIDFTDPKMPKFSATATTITAKWRGVAVTAMLKDENRFGVRNYFDVIIDGGPATKVTALATQTEYPVASNLSNGEHTVTLVKRTEAAIGFTQFLGFKFAGEILAPPAQPSHRIEILGDSITCGSGDEAANNSAQCTEDGWGQPYQNSYLSYGPVLARSLGAEYHVTSVSGIGLVRNYSSLYDARPLPAVYGLMFIEEMTSPPWPFDKFVPDAVVIGLGTNDFSPGDSARPAMDEATFTKGYVDFVTALRGHYPNAHIFGISSPMLGDGWPMPTDMALTVQKNTLTAVVDHFAALGDAKVHKFYVTKLIGEGCGTHPSVAQHAAMASEISAYVKTVMGW
jgi:lysophospholipase L1-like esterase